ncbi:translation initiation factor 2 [Synechococcus sp. AH-551-N17]|nr:translation initiation factor 2 [Synechococcus sp. AH-551-N17]
MALKSKGFFLNLEEGASTDQVLQIAPVRDLPVEDGEEESLAPIPAISKTTDGSGTAETAKPASAVSTPVTAAAPVTASAPAPAAPAAAAGSLTTAEAIASALAEAEAARPVATLSTFAPDMLQPGRALRSEPRRPGRNLKGFKDMASELFSS